MREYTLLSSAPKTLSIARLRSETFTNFPSRLWRTTSSAIFSDFGSSAFLKNIFLNVQAPRKKARDQIIFRQYSQNRAFSQFFRSLRNFPSLGLHLSVPIPEFLLIAPYFSLFQALALLFLQSP